MSRFLGVGIATLDIINTTAGFPNEDSEVRALSQRICRGGNVCNTLSILSQFGNSSVWCGTLGDDYAAHVITDDLQRQNVCFLNSQTIPGGRTPTSYITLNKQSGSRTIVHFRDLIELGFETFQQLDLSLFDCCHFEGRNVGETQKMIQFTRGNYPDMIISVEIEKPRENIEYLFGLANILFFSKDFAQQRNFKNGASFLNAPYLNVWREKSLLVCAWGDQGAWQIGGGQPLQHQPTSKQVSIVDTLGAGDTFIAAYLHQWLLDKDARLALEFATQLAEKKCSQIGFEGLV